MTHKEIAVAGNYAKEKRVIALALYADRQWIKEQTEKQFPIWLEECNGNIERAIELTIDTVHYGLLESGGTVVESSWHRYGLYVGESETTDTDYIEALTEHTFILTSRIICEFVPVFLPGYYHELTGGNCEALSKIVGNVEFTATDNGNLPHSFPIEVYAIDTTESELYNALGGATVNNFQELDRFEKDCLKTGGQG